MNFNEIYRSHLRTAAYRGLQCKKLMRRLHEYAVKEIVKRDGLPLAAKVQASIEKQIRAIRREAKEAASHALCSRPDLRMDD